VPSSSIVPCRRSSAKSRIVSIGAMNSATTAMLWKTGPISHSLSDIFGPPPNSIWPAIIDRRRKNVNA
jgi:hypothetical protein